MRTCAEPGCKRLVYPTKADYCDGHNQSGGCLGAFLAMVLVVGFMGLGLVGLLHSVPIYRESEKLMCWITDIAWPWEDQTADVRACVPIVPDPSFITPTK